MGFAFRGLARSVCFLACTAVVSQSQTAIPRLNSELSGKIVTLQKFLGGPDLRFRPDGMPVDSRPAGTWTLYGRVGVTEIVLEDSRRVVIRGHRVLLEFDKNGKERQVGTKEKVSIEIQFDAPPNDDAITSAIQKVLVPAASNLADYAPPEWRWFLMERAVAIAAGNTKRELPPLPAGVQKVEVGKVSAPRAVWTPDPAYEPKAKERGYQGTSVLACTIDETGRARDIFIVSPLGLGLDERAIEAVSQWTFNPGMENGKPVAVRISIEINFRLY